MPPQAPDLGALPLDGSAEEILRAYVAGSWGAGKPGDALRGLQAAPPGPLPPLPPPPDGDRGMALAVWEEIIRTTYERGAWAVAVRAMSFWTRLAFESGSSVEGITVDGIRHFLGLTDADDDADDDAE